MFSAREGRRLRRKRNHPGEERFSMVVACPVCGKKTEWEGNPFRPFCSERCKMVDLGAWAGEEYRIPGDKADDEEGGGDSL